MTTPDIAATTIAPPRRYDRVTMMFHWLTALAVVTLFGTAFWWNALPGGTPLRKWLQSFHISVALLFVAVFIGRVIWRWLGARKLRPANTGATALLERGVHGLLYLLLLAQIVLGFALRWAQGEPFLFFGLFSIPEILGPSKAWEEIFEALHNNVGWAIIYLAGAHALAALFHHYVLRDGVLRRMLPGR